MIYLNRYRCPCGEEWNGQADCSSEIEPYDSEPLGGEVTTDLGGLCLRSSHEIVEHEPKQVSFQIEGPFLEFLAELGDESEDEC